MRFPAAFQSKWPRIIVFARQYILPIIIGDQNGTDLRTLDAILDHKLVTSAKLKVVAPA